MNRKGLAAWILFLGVAVLLIGGLAGQDRPGHTPYDSVLQSVTVGVARAGFCPNERCVNSSVTPIICTYEVDEACHYTPPGGQPGSQCLRALCP